MARRATSLGPKPSLFVFVLFFVFFFFLFLSFLCFNRKALFSPPPPKKRAFLVFFFSVSLSFSLAFFGLPLFHFLFLCLSVFLFLLPSFLSFFFAFFLFLVFVSFFLFLSSLLLFHEKNNIKIFNYKVFLHHSFLIFVGFLSSFFLQIPFPYLCFFLILSFVFCSTSVFGFKECKFKKTHFFKKWVCNITVFFVNLCFAKCEKLSFFFAFFGQFLGCFQKTL